jgi:hypothetical protein
MCEKWWCECVFFIGNILVAIINLLQQIVAISDKINPEHFPRWSITEWSWSIFTNSMLIFLFFKTKQRTRHNLRPVEYNIYDSIDDEAQLSPNSRRNVWKSTNLDVQSNGTTIEVSIKRKIDKKGTENTYHMEIRTDDDVYSKFMVEKNYA